MVRSLEDKKREDEEGHSLWFGDSDLWIKVPEALRRSWVADVPWVGGGLPREGLRETFFTIRWESCAGIRTRSVRWESGVDGKDGFSDRGVT